MLCAVALRLTIPYSFGANCANFGANLSTASLKWTCLLGVMGDAAAVAGDTLKTLLGKDTPEGPSLSQHPVLLGRERAFISAAKQRCYSCAVR